jgi:uncharacterized membrane protein YeaQ/YmgE (transglycosylase-associated protein family)
MFIVMVISWIVFGFIVGLIARAITPGTQSMGFVGTTVIGVVGSVVGGVIGSLLSGHPIGTSQPAGWIGSIVGAMLVLAAVALLGRRAHV